MVWYLIRSSAGGGLIDRMNSVDGILGRFLGFEGGLVKRS
jgi:hypothetical protein